MRGAVGKDRQDKFDLFSAQRAQVYVDWILLALVNFTPLTERSNRTISDLVLETIDHVAIIRLIETTNHGLETIASFNFDGRIFTADQAIVAFFRISQQAASLRFAILQLGRV